MNKKKLIIIFGIIFLFAIVVYGLEVQTVYNPFTGKLDYIRGLNFTGEGMIVDNVTSLLYCNATNCYEISQFFDDTVIGNCSEAGSCSLVVYVDHVNTGNLNITGNYTGFEYRNASGSIEWITPERILDVDDADIETDLNTYVDIAGDTMTGSLGLGGDMECNGYNLIGIGNITTDSAYFLLDMTNTYYGGGILFEFIAGTQVINLLKYQNVNNINFTHDKVSFQDVDIHGNLLGDGEGNFTDLYADTIRAKEYNNTNQPLFTTSSPTYKNMSVKNMSIQDYMKVLGNADIGKNVTSENNFFVNATQVDNQDGLTEDGTSWTVNSYNNATWDDDSEYYSGEVTSTFTPTADSFYRITYDYVFDGGDSGDLGITPSFGGNTGTEFFSDGGDGSHTHYWAASNTNALKFAADDSTYGDDEVTISNIKIENMKEGFVFNNFIGTKYKNGEIESPVIYLNTPTLLYAGTFGFDIIPTTNYGIDIGDSTHYVSSSYLQNIYNYKLISRYDSTDYITFGSSASAWYQDGTASIINYDGSTVINVQKADKDFIVHGDSISNVFVVDAGLDEVRITHLNVSNVSISGITISNTGLISGVSVISGTGTANFQGGYFTSIVELTDTGLYFNGDNLNLESSQNITMNFANQVQSSIISGDTTASAANMYIDSSSPYQLMRSTSSERYKQNFTEIQDSYSDRINYLDPVSFYSNTTLNTGDDPSRKYVGLTAEDVAEYFPECVYYINETPDSLDWPCITTLLLSEVQEHEREIAIMKTETCALKIFSWCVIGDG